MSKRAVAELVAQLGRIVHGDAYTYGLTSAQWTALRYFSRANRFSRTLSAFAEFHATTRGTASQTIKILVQRGYLTRKRSMTDGRSVQFNLTNKSKNILSDDSFENLVAAAEGLSKSENRIVERSLGRMLRKLAQQQGKRHFGMCPNCKYLQKGEHCLKDEAAYSCTLMNEPLQETETEQLCVSFQPVQ